VGGGGGGKKFGDLEQQRGGGRQGLSAKRGGDLSKKEPNHKGQLLGSGKVYEKEKGVSKNNGKKKPKKQVVEAKGSKRSTSTFKTEAHQTIKVKQRKERGKWWRGQKWE